MTYLSQIITNKTVSRVMRNLVKGPIEIPTRFVMHRVFPGLNTLPLLLDNTMIYTVHCPMYYYMFW